MNTLGIDFGLKKVGIALAVGSLAEPYSVLKNNVISQISSICSKEGIDKIVIGISEGIMAEESKKFAEQLKKEVNLPIEFFDETLSTQEAQRLSMEAGIKRSKRKKLEDAYSATLMLQNYLDQAKLS